MDDRQIDSHGHSLDWTGRNMETFIKEHIRPRDQSNLSLRELYEYFKIWFYRYQPHDSPLPSRDHLYHQVLDYIKNVLGRHEPVDVITTTGPPRGCFRIHGISVYGLRIPRHAIFHSYFQIQIIQDDTALLRCDSAYRHFRCWMHNNMPNTPYPTGQQFMEYAIREHHLDIFTIKDRDTEVPHFQGIRNVPLVCIKKTAVTRRILLGEMHQFPILHEIGQFLGDTYPVQLRVLCKATDAFIRQEDSYWKNKLHQHVSTGKGGRVLNGKNVPRKEAEVFTSSYDRWLVHVTLSKTLREKKAYWPSLKTIVQWRNCNKSLKENKALLLWERSKPGIHSAADVNRRILLRNKLKKDRNKIDQLRDWGGFCHLRHITTMEDIVESGRILKDLLLPRVQAMIAKHKKRHHRRKKTSEDEN